MKLWQLAVQLHHQNEVQEESNDLRGDSGTYHAGMPTLQKVARGGGDDYSPNFLMSAESYDLDYLFDSHYDNDMVWYLNSSGEGFGNGDTDAAEVIEHVFHTIHMSGLDALALKQYSEFSSDWASGPTYASACSSNASARLIFDWYHSMVAE